METKRRKLTMNEVSARYAVEQLTLKHDGIVPTYQELAKHLGISRTAAYARTKKFRDIMRQKIYE